MAISGGDIIEITYNNPDLGAGTLIPKGSEDSTYDPGGIRTSDDDAMVDGQGNAIYQMNNKRWSFEVKCRWGMDDGDLETIAALQSVTSETTFTFANINGTIYRGKGKMVGDIKGNGNMATVDIKASGGGVLTII
jgi:hypothetical protein